MFRIGIIGAGWIAEKMARAVAPLKDIEINAISSRSIEKAKSFAAKHHIHKAYGSYEDLVTGQVRIISVVYCSWSISEARSFVLSAVRIITIIS